MKIGFIGLGHGGGKFAGSALRNGFDLFVHGTESQVILNGSRNISFTLDLVVKDRSIFQTLAERGQIPLEISPLLLSILQEGELRYGSGEWSPSIVRRLEDACGKRLIAAGFPSEIIDDEPEIPGEEIKVCRNRLV